VQVCPSSALPLTNVQTVTWYTRGVNDTSLDSLYGFLEACVADYTFSSSQYDARKISCYNDTWNTLATCKQQIFRSPVSKIKFKKKLGICIAPTQPFRAALAAESRVCYLGNTEDRKLNERSRTTTSRSQQQIGTESWDAGIWTRVIFGMLAHLSNHSAKSHPLNVSRRLTCWRDFFSFFFFSSPFLHSNVLLYYFNIFYFLTCTCKQITHPCYYIVSL
jgi:hypothetical protein